jgi:signal transduction histidine kinase
LLLVALLTFQTHYAVTAHRRMAEEVLRDYASLVADEFIRRGSVEIGYYGFYPLITILSGDAELPDPETLIESDDERVARAAGLARSFFRRDPATGDVSTTGDPLNAEQLAWLSETLSSVEPNENPYAQLYSRIDGEHLNVVYSAPTVAGLIHGFVVDNAALPGWLETATSRQPLLPPSLAHGEVGNEHIFVELTTTHGDVLFRQGRYGESSLFVTKPFSVDGPALFGGMTVRATIDPTVSGELVIGGLPRSRLPVLLTLWVLAAVLIVMAILLLRRERALARLRSDFVSRVSHELRTPLTQIRMFAETLLLGRVRNEDEARQSLEVIDKEARRLTHLVENILQFSRGERGAVKLDLISQPIYPLVRELANDFRPLMKTGRLVISSDVSDDVTVKLDSEAFQQMFVNLLDNAVKYGPEGEEVGVSLSSSNGQVSLSIEDRGPGIPEPERARIWEPYYRARRERDSAIAGTGIGLAVVHELARLHGADAEVEERSKGGARFVIRFPREAAGAA